MGTIDPQGMGGIFLEAEQNAICGLQGGSVFYMHFPE